MSERTEQSIVISASPADIMAVIADFPKYPEWVSSTKEVTVTEDGPDGNARQVAFVLDAGVLKDSYELRYEWAADGLAVSWELVRSDLQKSQHGRYGLVPLAEGSTKVTYELTVDVTIPIIGPLKRRAEKAITDAALKELKKRVEG